jgi:hypothetical protein
MEKARREKKYDVIRMHLKKRYVTSINQLINMPRIWAVMFV